MTPGGALVVGTTLAIAALDGGLTAMLTASAIGGGAYVVTRRRMNAQPERVLETQRKVLEGNIALRAKRGATDDEVKNMQKEAKAKLEKLAAVTEEQRWGNKEMAAAVGVASFACPLLGCVVLASLTEETWRPVVERWGSEEPTSDVPVTQFFSKSRVLRRAYAAAA